jgi:enoyl-CoA hydratase/carnithine racemase
MGQSTRSEVVRTEVRVACAVVTIDNPAARNAIDRFAMRAVADQVAEAASTPGVRAVVITGGPLTFCAGAALGNDDVEQAADPVNTVMADAAAMIRAILESPVPVIAAVEGAAAGVGASLAFACDLVVAGESAFFLLPFGKIGLIPDGGVTLSAAASLGRHRALHLALRQERLPAAEAAEAGLVAVVVDPGEAFATALKWAEEFAGSSRRALAEAKAGINRATLGGLDDVLADETRVQAELLGSEDYREGVAAFLERRTPNFS